MRASVRPAWSGRYALVGVHSEYEHYTRQAIFLENIVEPLSRCFTPEVAQQVAELQADDQLQARVDILAEKCNEGQLTPEEREEYELYVRAGNFLALLQAKARALSSSGTHA